MPAVVTNLLCAEGDHVTQGQGLVVVAAMKMEMTLTAPFAGTVTAVRAQVGAKVSPGEILVDIAPEPSEAGPDNAPDGGEG
jgi:biotin carboxyl carrier protein